jgi:hypothetical protein
MDIHPPRAPSEEVKHFVLCDSLGNVVEKLCDTRLFFRGGGEGGATEWERTPVRSSDVDFQLPLRPFANFFEVLWHDPLTRLIYPLCPFYWTLKVCSMGPCPRAEFHEKEGHKIVSVEEGS